jgi:hypothetical protein
MEVVLVPLVLLQINVIFTNPMIILVMTLVMLVAPHIIIMEAKYALAHVQENMLIKMVMFAIKKRIANL